MKFSQEEYEELESLSNEMGFFEAKEEIKRRIVLKEICKLQSSNRKIEDKFNMLLKLLERIYE